MFVSQTSGWRTFFHPAPARSVLGLNSFRCLPRLGRAPVLPAPSPAKAQACQPSAPLDRLRRPKRSFLCVFGRSRAAESLLQKSTRTGRRNALSTHQPKASLNGVFPPVAQPVSAASSRRVSRPVQTGFARRDAARTRRRTRRRHASNSGLLTKLQGERD